MMRLKTFFITSFFSLSFAGSWVATAADVTLSEARAKNLEAAAQAVLSALKNKDGKALAGWVDEGRGLRFLPYPWDDIENTVVMSPSELRNFFKSRSVKRWGAYDGSGDPIRLTPAKYYKAFIWNVDYTRVQDRQRVALAEHLQKVYQYRGSNEDVLLAFPEAWVYTVFHPGVTAPEGGAMDWSWLSLVFLPKGEGWTLAGIVHKEWTI